jgi:hypothetical protein
LDIQRRGAKTKFHDGTGKIRVRNGIDDKAVRSQSPRTKTTRKNLLQLPPRDVVDARRRGNFRVKDFQEKVCAWSNPLAHASCRLELTAVSCSLRPCT